MIQVRRTRYRGVDGYKVVGYANPDRSGWPISIFTETEPSARHIAAKVKRGERITLEDFDATQ